MDGFTQTDTRFVFKLANPQNVKAVQESQTDTRFVFKQGYSYFDVDNGVLKPTQDLYLNLYHHPIKAFAVHAQTDTRFVFKHAFWGFLMFGTATQTDTRFVFKRGCLYSF